MTDPLAANVPAADLARAHGVERAQGRLKVDPEDFAVDEILGFQPSGAGEHLWLRVEKRGLDTVAVQRALAEAAGVRVADVGYAGLKDRHAVTSQWFSLPARGELPALPASCRVLEHTHHTRKLRRGAHRANRFRLVVRGLRGFDADRLAMGVDIIAARGVPNYFGEQRFGRGGSSLANARALLLDGEPVRDRVVRGLALSAARAMLFNRVLDARVRAACWDRILSGELVALDGSRSRFRAAEPDPVLARRLRAFDVHPSGPLPGSDPPSMEGEAGEVEERALAACGEWVSALVERGVAHDRRPLRVAVRELAWEGRADALVLDFVLPKGAYATMVVRELIAPV